jgi:hypothetical protein
MAALQAIHDHAGNLGANCSMAEGAKTTETPDLKLNESAVSTEDMQLVEATAGSYEVKLIAPGKGSTAYYPPDVLKRDGPKAFPAETKVYLNHPTAATESEGAGNRDIKRLAGVLAGPAEWHESHKAGPGLYSRVKVFSDHAQTFNEKAKYLGMSIMANGRQVVEAGKKVFKDGVPLLAELIHGESVDVVPMAGAGGLILTEAASTAESQHGGEMDAAEIKKLQEANARIAKRLAVAEAREVVGSKLKSLRLSESRKVAITERAVSNVPLTEDGELDTKAMDTLIEAEIQYAASLMEGGVKVTGMGSGTAQLTEAQKTQMESEEAAAAEKLSQRFAKRMGVKTKEARAILDRGPEAFDPYFNAREVA